MAPNRPRARHLEAVDLGTGSAIFLNFASGLALVLVTDRVSEASTPNGAKTKSAFMVSATVFFSANALEDIGIDREITNT